MSPNVKQYRLQIVKFEVGFLLRSASVSTLGIALMAEGATRYVFSGPRADQYERQTPIFSSYNLRQRVDTPVYRLARLPFSQKSQIITSF